MEYMSRNLTEFYPGGILDCVNVIREVITFMPFGIYRTDKSRKSRRGLAK